MDTRGQAGTDILWPNQIKKLIWSFLLTTLLHFFFLVARKEYLLQNIRWKHLFLWSYCTIFYMILSGRYENKQVIFAVLAKEVTLGGGSRSKTQMYTMWHFEKMPTKCTCNLHSWYFCLTLYKFKQLLRIGGYLTGLHYLVIPPPPNLVLLKYAIQCFFILFYFLSWWRLN